MESPAGEDPAPLPPLRAPLPGRAPQVCEIPSRAALSSEDSGGEASGKSGGTPFLSALPHTRGVLSNKNIGKNKQVWRRDICGENQPLG